MFIDARKQPIYRKKTPKKNFSEKGIDKSVWIDDNYTH